MLEVEYTTSISILYKGLSWQQASLLNFTDFIERAPMYMCVYTHIRHTEIKIFVRFFIQWIDN